MDQGWESRTLACTTCRDKSKGDDQEHQTQNRNYHNLLGDHSYFTGKKQDTESPHINQNLASWVALNK